MKRHHNAARAASRAFFAMICLALCSSFFLTACGQTGKLYLPDSHQQQDQTR